MGQSETALQQQCVMWFHNKYPELRGLLFMVNNNSRSKREGAFKKALGLIAGVSDLIFLYDGFCYCIELKTLSGSQSPDQVAWQEKVEGQGISYNIVNSYDRFQKLITKIINEL